MTPKHWGRGWEKTGVGRGPADGRVPGWLASEALAQRQPGDAGCPVLLGPRERPRTFPREGLIPNAAVSGEGLWPLPPNTLFKDNLGNKGRTKRFRNTVVLDSLPVAVQGRLKSVIVSGPVCVMDAPRQLQIWWCCQPGNVESGAWVRAPSSSRICRLIVFSETLAARQEKRALAPALQTRGPRDAGASQRGGTSGPTQGSRA